MTKITVQQATEAHALMKAGCSNSTIAYALQISIRKVKRIRNDANKLQPLV